VIDKTKPWFCRKKLKLRNLGLPGPGHEKKSKRLKIRQFRPSSLYGKKNVAPIKKILIFPALAIMGRAFLVFPLWPPWAELFWFSRSGRLGRSFFSFLGLAALGGGF
jgi:hypothetical protein